MKIVINQCYGGYGLSDAAIERYAELSGITTYPEKSKYSSGSTIFWEDEERTVELTNPERNDPLLIQAIEELGTVVASGQFSELSIVEIPDDVVWEIEEYDGIEWVSEVHRTWS